jgi:hypothetical protein
MKDAMADKLTLRKSEWLDDWYIIERAEHDGREWTEPMGGNGFALRTSARFSDADVEGAAVEMLGIAAAIERRGEEGFKRCAVSVDGDKASFWSPRNSQTEGVVSLAAADALAAEIRAKLAPTPSAAIPRGTGEEVGTDG